MHDTVKRDLTKNQELVMQTLSKAASPLSAYMILDQLREDGFRAPLQVYRAVEKLQEFGLVHRLESLNAFVACSHPSCQKQETLVFMICETCNQVDEIADDNLSDKLHELAAARNFNARRSAIELRGSCAQCC